MNSGRGYDAFISYSKKDVQEVEKLARYLSDAGVRPWLDRWELVPGESWADAVRIALCEAPAVLVCIGESGLARSQLDEAGAFLEKQRKVVIPVLLPGADMRAIPPWLRQFRLIDFRKGLFREADVIPLVMAIEGIAATGLHPAELMHGSPSDRQVLATLYARSGDRYLFAGNTTLAHADYRSAIEIRKELAAADPSNASWQRDLSVSYSKLADVLTAQGQLAAAHSANQASLAIFERLAAADPSNASWQRDVWVTLWRLASIPESRVTWVHVLTRMEAMKARGTLMPSDEKFL
ncbi:MAG: toll/interleukin-1 receptor domain-containing protein, partial [Candidatus Binatia bacterium]